MDRKKLSWLTLFYVGCLDVIIVVPFAIRQRAALMPIIPSTYILKEQLESNDIDSVISFDILTNVQHDELQR